MEDIKVAMSRGRRGKKKAAAKKKRKVIKEPKEIIYPAPKENICIECLTTLEVYNYTFLTDDNQNELKCVYCESVTRSQFVPLNRGYIRNCSR